MAAWFLTAVALVLIIVAGLTGLVVHGQQIERARIESVSRMQVRAVLLEDVVIVKGERGGDIPIRAQARWPDRDGVQHTGGVIVRRAAVAGEHVDIWVDRSGAIAAPPTRAENVVVAAILAVVGVLVAGGTVLLACWYTVRILIGSWNARRWEQEWAGVEPVWSRDLP
ncbi:MAG TPA: hypothetical protein VGN22_21080 [Pseudonocardia sp.]